jgi:UDP-glucose 4-epimerase
MKRRILVTGGAGFIGSHLVDHLLLCDDNEVTVIDDFSTGSMDNLVRAMGFDTFRAVRGSVTDYVTMQTMFAVIGFSEVYHLAAAVGVKRVVGDPLSALRTNIAGTENVLDLSLRFGVSVVFVASSSEVYGRGSGHVKLKETDDVTIGPPSRLRWAYAISKLADEAQALSYFRKRDLPVVVGRLFNVSGPRQTGAYGMVIPRFIEQARNGKPLTVFGDGSQVRCFCHVSDAVRYVVAMIREPMAHGEVVNIGSDSPISIAGLAEMVIAMSESKSAIEYVDPELVYGPDFDDMESRVPDLTKLRGLVGNGSIRKLDDIIREIEQCSTTVQTL